MILKNNRNALEYARRLVQKSIEALLEAEFRQFMAREKAAGRQTSRNGYNSKTPERSIWQDGDSRPPGPQGPFFAPPVAQVAKKHRLSGQSNPPYLPHNFQRRHF